MPGATAAVEDFLPVRIDEAEVEGPTLMLRGDGWSLAATCDWQWTEPGERSVADSDPRASDAAWELIGHQIVAVEWVRTTHGTDPIIVLDGGLSLHLTSDAAFDTWTIRIPDIELVGPLPY